jgi:putative transposase
LFREQVQQWKLDCLSGFQTSEVQAKTIKQQAKADKAEIKSLKHELRYKENALAEAAALLVLRKKLNTLLGDESEESYRRWYRAASVQADKAPADNVTKAA